MQESKRFFREARALKLFVVGVLCLCFGLVSWKNMDKPGRIFWRIITPACFISSLVWYWFSQPKRRKHRRVTEPQVERRNPPAKLPPRRDL